MTQEPTPPREESTFRWLWRFGFVRSVLAIGFIGMTLLQSALEVLPDPSEQQWNLPELAFVFYFATAAAQGIRRPDRGAGQGVGRAQGRRLGLTMAIGPEVNDALDAMPAAGADIEAEVVAPTDERVTDGQGLRGELESCGAEEVRSRRPGRLPAGVRRHRCQGRQRTLTQRSRQR